jgi:hypothetical protein
MTEGKRREGKRGVRWSEEKRKKEIHTSHVLVTSRSSIDNRSVYCFPCGGGMGGGRSSV